jgi:hypothetical protein
MPTRDAIAALRERLKLLREAGTRYFGQVGGEKVRETYNSYRWELTGAEGAGALRTDIKSFSVELAGAARGSPLIAEADLQDLRHKSRQMLARFNYYRHQGLYVHPRRGHRPLALTRRLSMRMPSTPPKRRRECSLTPRRGWAI